MMTLATKKRPPADPDAFDEAVAWHRERLPITDDEFHELEAEAALRSFTVAGVSQLDLVTDVWEAVDRAVANGESLEDFQERVSDKLTAAWGKEDPYRIDTIYRTNLQQSYMAGRYEQMTHPAVAEARPFWRFSAIDDERTCPICGPCDGVVLSADHPWWKTHYPLLHFRCRCHAVTLSAREAEGLVTEDVPSVAALEGFGGPPANEPYEPDLGEYPAALATAYGG